MISLGETLRRERIRQGLELQGVSEITKIGTRMLQAMEHDDLSKLPGGVFTRSFFKQYAIALGLDPASLDEQLKSLPTGTEEPARSEARKTIIPERSHYSLSDYNSARNNGSLIMSAIWVGLALTASGAVYYWMNRTPSAPSTAPETPLKQPAASVRSETPPATPVAPPNAEAPLKQETQAAPVDLTLKALEDSWISLSADGESVFSGQLKATETRSVQAQQRVKLVAGNAGGLEIQLNGKPLEPIGPRGQVRAVEFTPEGSHVVPRASPKPAPLP